jgi:[ribosomal protein S18]-alanine N-acetyltransferase
MHIRRLTPADISAVTEIDAAAGILSPWSVAVYEKNLQNVAVLCWAAESDGRVIGSLTMWNVAGEAEIANVAVHPEFWRQGVGRALVQIALTTARELGLTKMMLEVRASNEPAQRLYRDFGFAEDGRRKRYYANGEDAILMSVMLD